MPDRGVVKVAGDDARKFLNGLLTTDIAKVTPERAAFAALLTPQGKIMVDMIVAEAPAEDGGGFFLDCPRALAQTLTDRLNFYKLRAKVLVEDLSEVLGVMAVWDGARRDRIRPVLRRSAPAGARRALHAAAAPRRRGGRRSRRDAGRGKRIRGAPHRARRAARRARFQYNDAFPHEADMDQLNGIDFEKGCYVGQEVVSRVEHRGTARKRVVPVDFRGFRRRRPASPVQGRRHRSRRDGLVGAAAAAALRCCVSTASAKRSRPASR